MGSTGKLILLSAFLSSVLINSYSQEKKNAIILELAGKSDYYFDLCYERSFYGKFHLGIGAGMGNINTLYISPEESGKEYELRFPVYGGYSFLKKKHRIITQLGGSLFYDYPTTGSSTSEFFPFVTAGYEFRGFSLILRAQIYLFFVGSYEEYSDFFPFAGISIGLPF
jgi:hypothetical protein